MTVLLIGSSCGFFSDEDLKSNHIHQVDTSQYCAVDIADFENFFNQKIEYQLNCLEQNFDHFIRYTKRRSHQDIVEKNDIERFVNRFFSQHAEVILNVVQFIFEFNIILLHNQNNELHNKQVPDIFDFLRTINREAVIVSQYLAKVAEATEQDVNYFSLRPKLKRSLNIIKDAFIQMISLREEVFGKEAYSIHLQSFFENGMSYLASRKNDELLIKLLSGIKVYLVGGTRENLNSTELLELVNKAPDIFLYGLDLFHVDQKIISEESPWELWDFYLSTVGSILGLMASDIENQETVFSGEWTKKVVELLPETIELNRDRVLSLSESAGRNLFGIEGDSYRVKDVGIALFFSKILMALNASQVEFNNLEKEDVSIVEYRKNNRRFLDNMFKRSLRLQESLKALKLPKIINYYKFLSDVADIDSDEDSFISKENLKLLTLGKKISTGGEEKTMTSQELTRALQVLPYLYADFYRVNYLLKERSIINREWRFEALLLLQNIKSRYLYSENTPGRVVTNLEDFFDIASLFQDKYSKDNLSFAAVKDLAIEFLIRLNGSDGKSLRIIDLSYFVDALLDYLHTILYADIAFESLGEFSSISTLPKQVPYFFHQDLIRLPAPLLSNYRSNFDYLFKNFRYFREEGGLYYFGNSIVRPKEGFIEVVSTRWIVQKIIKAFDDSKSKELNLDEIENALFSFRPLLEEIRMWGPEMEAFVRNTLLLSDLFQSLSDGSNGVDVDEFTEFSVLARMSMQLANNLLDYLKPSHIADRFNCELDDSHFDGPAIPVECFRRNFFDILFNELEMKKYLPYLYKYYTSTDRDEHYEYLRYLEGFSRDIFDDSIPINFRDLAKIIGSMLNIESVFDRFDTDRSNTLEITELDKSFEIFRHAIISVAGLSRGQEKYARSIYLYMIRESQIPTRFQLARFHNFGNKSRITAERINIASILYFLVNQE